MDYLKTCNCGDTTPVQQESSSTTEFDSWDPKSLRLPGSAVQESPIASDYVVYHEITAKIPSLRHELHIIHKRLGLCCTEDGGCLRNYCRVS